jgi:hypothetical protein
MFAEKARTSALFSPKLTPNHVSERWHPEPLLMMEQRKSSALALLAMLSPHPWCARSLRRAAEGALLATFKGGSPDISAMCYVLTGAGTHHHITIG